MFLHIRALLFPEVRYNDLSNITDMLSYCDFTVIRSPSALACYQNYSNISHIDKVTAILRNYSVSNMDYFLECYSGRVLINDMY